MSRLSLLLSALALASGALSAQEARGTLVGRVVDSTSAGVPNATVVVTNKSMGTSQRVVTNDTGFYQAAYLIPGAYRVEVSVTGFMKFVQDPVEVRVNDRIELPITLQLGTAEQSVTVVGETPLLNTASASLGTVIDARCS